MSAPQKVSRRTLVDWLLAGGLFTWLAGFIVPVTCYLWPVQRRGPAAQSASAGKASEFAEWQAKIVAVNAQPIIVVRTPQGFRAFSALCTHLGCVVVWEGERRQIACPCHAGFFDANGRVVSGPPPRPLAEHAVAVVNGEVMVSA